MKTIGINRDGTLKTQNVDNHHFDNVDSYHFGDVQNCHFDNVDSHHFDNVDSYHLVPLGHFNWKYSPTRSNYPTYEQEILSGIVAM